MVRLASLLVLLALPAFAADAGTKPRIAVMYYRDLANDPELAFFAKGLASITINDLGDTGFFKPVERERLDELMAEKKLGTSDVADKATFGKIAAVLGTEYFVTGQIVQLKKGQYFLMSKIINAETFEIVGSNRVALDPEDVMTAVDQIVQLATVKIRAAGSYANGPAPAPVQKVQRDYKVPLSTALKYARALDAKDKKDSATATKLLTEVTTEQPAMKLAKLDLLSLTR